MKKSKNNLSLRDRILSTAGDLFFQQGYRATGINQVIDESGVAKATFYNHFPTKADLCLAYLQERNSSEYTSIAAFLQEKETPRDRFLGVIESIEPWLEANGLRGCAFLNMVAEVPDPRNLLRQEGIKHYEKLRRLIRGLAHELFESDRSCYGHLDPDRVTDDYLVILGGAIAMSEIYHETWPVKQAVEMVRRMADGN